MKQIKAYNIPILIALAVALGVVIGNNLKKNAQLSQAISFSNNTGKLSTILSLIRSEYVDSVSIAEIEEEIIPEVVRKLDPHSIYIPAENTQKVAEEMTGNFGGIGVQFNMQKDTVMVIDVIPGGPSKIVGIMAGDRIVKVNDSIIAGVGMKDSDIVGMLRGPKGTKVTVQVFRLGTKELLDFEITRDDIPLYSVDVSYMVNNEIGFVKVSRFSEKTYDEFKEALVDLSEDGCEKLIVDLRGNTGGALGPVLRMCDEFLQKGEMMLYTKGYNRPQRSSTARQGGLWIDKEVMVLIDEFSASASEIFAGAIQDNDRGIIVGRRSFGKGLVQEQIPLADGSAFRITTAKYYTPSGRCIQKPYDRGNSEDYFNDISNRYQHGEFMEADSIHFADSLKYYTKKGRLVYGGGGIMPDHFVPADTTGYSDYYDEITRKGLVYGFAFQYADENRNKLNKLKSAAEFESYLGQNNIFEQFLAYTVENGVKTDRKGLQQSGKILEVQVEAYIARNIMGEEGFYAIIKQVDKTLQKAIEIFEKE